MVTSGTLRIQIRLLGLVEVSLDGRPVALGGSKQRALLALLALNVNEPVSTDQLIEGLWGEFAPPSAAKMVQLYVSQLRRLFEGGDGVIVTRGRGYELSLSAEAVDAVRFERLVAEASGADERASAIAGEALALWRGRPLDDIADQPFAGAEIRRLEEQWVRARELAIDGALAAGGHRKVLSELDELVGAYPLREGIHGQRMLALYRSGRQADALEAYRHARGVLVREAGVEPGPELRRLHAAILDQDPSLDLPASRSARAPVVSANLSGGRRAVVLVAALLVAAALVAVVVVASGSDSSPPSVPANAVAIVDPAKAAVAGSIALGEGPGPIVAGARGLVVLTLNSQSLAHIDAARRRIVATAGVGGSPGTLAVTADDLWVTQHCGEGGPGSVFRYVMGSDGAINITDADEISLAGIAARAGRSRSRRARDAASRRTRGPYGWPRASPRASLESTSTRQAWRESREPLRCPSCRRPSRWGRDRFGSPTRSETRSCGSIRSRSPACASSRRETIPLPSHRVSAPCGWPTTATAPSRVDPRINGVTKAISVGANPVALAVGKDSVWVANSGDGSVSRIDPDTNGVTATVAVGHRPQGIAVAGGAVWVTVRP